MDAGIYVTTKLDRGRQAHGEGLKKKEPLSDHGEFKQKDTKC